MSAPYNNSNTDNDNENYGSRTPPASAPPPASPTIYSDFFPQPMDGRFVSRQDVEDEALARRLQEEENRLMSFRANKNQVAPHHKDASSNAMELVDEAYSRQIAQELDDENIAFNLQQKEQQQQYNRNKANIVSNNEESKMELVDEEYAKQLAQQLEDEKIAFNLQQNENEHNIHNSNIASNNNERNMDLLNEEYSIQLAQEMEDQQIAYGLQKREQARANRLAEEVNARKKWTKRRIFNVVLLISIVASSVLVFAFFGSSLWRRGELDSNLPPYFSNDWGGAHSTTDFSRWRNDGKGLPLNVQNALSSEWDKHFEQAINDWNSGSPDALDLFATRAAPDPQCSPIQGIMKVCNNFYGSTGWTGLNEVYYDKGGYITYSVAKMNEDYLSRAKSEERQYVMCHELGHGFGLPHRDEITHNADLGTCLDYTHRPEANQHPDSVDFENLANLYGTVPLKTRSLLLRTRKDQSIHNRIDINYKKSLPNNDEIDQQQALLIPHSNNSFQEDGRLLHHTEHGAIYERDAHNGGRIVSYVVFSKNI